MNKRPRVPMTNLPNASGARKNSSQVSSPSISPMNGISDLLNYWTQRDQPDNQGFSILVLFDLAASSFAAMYYQILPSLIEAVGDNCYLSTIAPPPTDWEVAIPQAIRARHFLANATAGQPYQVSDIHLIARQFDIPTEHLPAIVVIRSLEFYDTINIFPGDFELESARAYLTNLVRLLSTATAQDPRVWQLARFLDFLPRDHPQIDGWLADMLGSYLKSGKRSSCVFGGKPYRPHKIVHHVDFPRMIRGMLGDLNIQLSKPTSYANELSSDNRNATSLRGMVRTSSARVEENRTEFVTRIAELDENEEVIGRINKREHLRQEFDRQLQSQSQEIVQEIQHRRGTTLQLPPLIHTYESLLEEESRKELTTAETIWRFLITEGYQDEVDFAICGVGLWKALEIEVNRTFIDALRIYHGFARPGQSSTGMPPLKPGEYKEHGLFSSESKKVNLTQQNDRLFISVSLGAVSALLRNSAENNLRSIIESLPPIILQQGLSTFPKMTDIKSKTPQLADEVSKVADRYRNVHAHWQPMKQAICAEFYEYLVGSQWQQSPLIYTLEFKRHLLQQKLI